MTNNLDTTVLSELFLEELCLNWTQKNMATISGTPPLTIERRLKSFMLNENFSEVEQVIDQLKSDPMFHVKLTEALTVNLPKCWDPSFLFPHQKSCSFPCYLSFNQDLARRMFNRRRGLFSGHFVTQELELLHKTKYMLPIWMTLFANCKREFIHLSKLKITE